MPYFWSLGRTISTCVSLRLPRVDSATRPDLQIIEAPAESSLISLQPSARQLVRAAAPMMELLRFGAQHGVEFTHDDVRLRFIFDVEEATVRFAALGHVDDELLASIIEGPVLGMALRLSGQALLHASAVQWRGHGLAISADSGLGKSTFAAFLCRDGAVPWSDDILSYDPQTARAFGDARPSRLTPQSQALAGLSHEGSAIYDGSEKRFSTPIPTLSDLQRRPQPLDQILILGPRVDSDQPLWTTLTGTRASAAILAGRFPSWLRDTKLQREAFEAAELLTQKVPVTLLHLPEGLLRLREAVGVVGSWLDSTAPSVARS